jgi:transposase InsO family protein
MCAELHVSERRACAALGQHRSTQRKVPRGRDDEERLTADIIALARQYGRYGYRKIAALLRQRAGSVNDKRVERIWRREGLKVPQKQPKRGRLWLATDPASGFGRSGRNHVWSYDFVEDRTHDGRKFRMLNVIDEFTHECLAIRVDRKLKADRRDRRAVGPVHPARRARHIRSDNGPEFVAKAVQEWIAAVGCQNRLHRARQPVGERLRRELQRPPARRAARRRDLLHAEGGTDRDRELAAPLQLSPGNWNAFGVNVSASRSMQSRPAPRATGPKSLIWRSAVPSDLGT